MPLLLTLTNRSIFQKLAVTAGSFLFWECFQSNPVVQYNFYAPNNISCYLQGIWHIFDDFTDFKQFWVISFPSLCLIISFATHFLFMPAIFFYKCRQKNITWRTSFMTKYYKKTTKIPIVIIITHITLSQIQCNKNKVWWTSIQQGTPFWTNTYCITLNILWMLEVGCYKYSQDLMDKYISEFPVYTVVIHVFLVCSQNIKECLLQNAHDVYLKNLEYEWKIHINCS